MRAIIPQRNHRTLSLAGPTILTTTILVWIIMIWIGWSLIFYSAPGSLNDTSDKTVPDFIGHMWYVAYTMFTVGNGDFAPTSDTWQFLSSLIAFGGMTMVTLSVTYVLQVLSALVTKRAFAAQVTSIASSSEEFVIDQWTGKDFGAIELQLNTFSSLLSTLSEQHLAYPILHYYHAAQPSKANAVAVVILDEALTIIEHGIKEENQPAQTILKSTRQSIRSYLNTLRAAFISASDDLPPVPKFRSLKEKGLPVVEEQKFHNKLEELKDRRKLLLGLIQNDAWYWPPIKQSQNG